MGQAPFIPNCSPFDFFDLQFDLIKKKLYKT
jgi:hypothetical protein